MSDSIPVGNKRVTINGRKYVVEAITLDGSIGMCTFQIPTDTGNPFVRFELAEIIGIRDGEVWEILQVPPPRFYVTNNYSTCEASIRLKRSLEDRKESIRAAIWIAGLILLWVFDWRVSVGALCVSSVVMGEIRACRQRK